MSEPAADATAPASFDTAPGWQPLPARARLLFALGVAVPIAIPAVAAGFFLTHLLDGPRLLGAACGAALLFALGFVIGLRQFRAVAWRLDAEGLAIRRGRLWQRETRVPITRVQHLDVRRGPWQRQRGLATLVVHTAGTRHNAVSVPHLDADDAERLRDVLGRQIDHDDD